MDDQTIVVRNALLEVQALRQSVNQEFEAIQLRLEVLLAPNEPRRKRHRGPSYKGFLDEGKK